MATPTVESLQEKLRHARLRRHQAERELNAIERQQGLNKGRSKMLRDLERAETKVAKLKEEEAHLLQEIEHLTHPAEAPTPDAAEAPAPPSGEEGNAPEEPTT